MNMPATPRVVLVAEHADSASFIKRLLKAASCDLVTEAAMGAEAVVSVREHHPDVVLLALEEPVARGLRTIESLRLAAGDYPILAVSSLKDRESLRRAMLAGAQDYLARPLGAEEFRQALDQVLERNRKRPQADEGMGQPGQVITIFSGKGGTGRSTLAVNLATALSRETHQRVVLVDLDTALGDLALLLNITPERTLADLAPQIDKVDAELLRSFLSTHESGVRLLAAPLRPEEGEAVPPGWLGRVLEVLVKTYDYVIVDAPRTFSEDVLTALDMAQLVLLVAAPDIVSLKNTKLCVGMMRLWRYPQEKVKLVLNYPTPGREMGGAEIEQAVDYPIFWKLPNSPAVATAARRGRPVVLADPRNTYARNVLHLAKVLAGSYRPPKGLLSRLFAPA